jgi:hypothetical protein
MLTGLATTVFPQALPTNRNEENRHDSND